MARFSAGARSAGAGSTTLPVGSIYSVASRAPRLREVGVVNTTSTAVALHLVRLTTTGTQGAGLTEDANDAEGSPVQATCFNTHTVAPTLGNDTGYRCTLGAAVGSAMIWSFGETGLRIPPGTGNGIGIIVSTGTGQVVDYWFVWDE